MRRVIRRVDPWSVFRFSIVFYLCLLVVVLVAGVVLWLVASATGAIDNIETNDRAASVAAYLECRCIEHQDILQRLPEPRRERLLPVRFAPEVDQLIDARGGVSSWIFLIAWSDRPFHLFDLVFAGLYRQPRDVVVFRQCPQLFEADGLV